MKHLELTLKNFIAEEAGYDLVEFAMGAALAGSVGFVAVKGDILGTASSFIHSIVNNF